jgi:hypothetical protein
MELSMILRAAAFVVLAAMPVSASAASDWSAVTQTWKSQLGELEAASATIQLCKLDVDGQIRDALKRTQRGLYQALGYSKQEQKSSARLALVTLATQAGSQASPCAADGTVVTAAQTTLAGIRSSLLADGTLKASAPAEPGPPAGVTVNPAVPAQAGVVPTPIANISLIQNCRTSVVGKLGARRAARNRVFWRAFEQCIGSQGVGWF